MTKKRGENVDGDRLDDIRVGFDGLLGALGATLAEITNRLEHGQASEVRRSFEVDTGSGPVRAEAGIRVRFADTSPGTAKMRTRPRERAQPSPPRQEKAARIVDVEIVEDSGTWRFCADMPGADEGEVVLSQVEGDLVVETTGARRFRATGRLPDGIGPDDLTISLRNGILEVSCDLGSRNEAGLG